MRAARTWLARPCYSGIVIYECEDIVSQTPLYNMNVLVTVILGLPLFAEYRDLHVVRPVSGTSLLIAGALLVAGA
jgi:hypothetical protein